MTWELWAMLAIGAVAALALPLIGIWETWHMRNVARDFAARFPGRCMVCSFHSCALHFGHTSEPRPPPHYCIEGRLL